MRLICSLLTVMLITCQNSYQIDFSQPKNHLISLERVNQDIEEVQSSPVQVQKFTEREQQLSQTSQEKPNTERIPSLTVEDNNTNQSQESDKSTETNKNESFGECAQRVSGVSTLLGVVGGGATAGIGSAAGLSSVGFTTSGVASGSIAAGIQSFIGVIEAGSTFSYLQSLGALGEGVLGAAVLPVTLAVGVIAGGGYLAYECYQTIK